MNYRLAFYNEIKQTLNKLLYNTDYWRIPTSEYRANQLMDIHKVFLQNTMNKLSAEEIALSLFKYDENLRR